MKKSIGTGIVVSQPLGKGDGYRDESGEFYTYNHIDLDIMRVAPKWIQECFEVI